MTLILIVEDQEENLYYLSALLKGNGYSVATAPNGKVALQKARLKAPDLIVSDLLMPVMDGYSLLKQWKADSSLKEIPFIVYTATYIDAEDEKLARDLGADAFILKPAEPEYFITKLKEIESRARAHELQIPKTSLADEKNLLKSYNETLIRKLETKTLQLEESNKALKNDIDERKRLEEQILRTQRMESIGTLAGGIAHDLNNLLSPIILGTDLLRQYPIPEQMSSIVENISRSARRGSELIKQLLSFASGVEGERKNLHIEHILCEVESIVRNTFPKNITFQRETEDNLWPVSGDATQLNQVTLNLCVNARDAMENGGKLKISTRNIHIDQQYVASNPGATQGRYVAIEVSDEGCGMSKDVSNRIFEPFFTTKEVGKGTGLGLSTAMGIVSSHGGFINVYSEVGKGTVFRVYIPAMDEDESVAASTPSDADLYPRGNGEYILLVDDEASLLTITSQTLEIFGYNILTAEDGAHAVGIFAQHQDQIALVITDMMMPIMDGPELIKNLRQFKPNLPIIAASGLNTNASLANTHKSSNIHFIDKPYSATHLLTLIQTALTAAS